MRILEIIIVGYHSKISHHRKNKTKIEDIPLLASLFVQNSMQIAKLFIFVLASIVFTFILFKFEEKTEIIENRHFLKKYTENRKNLPLQNMHIIQFYNHYETFRPITS